jgi:hypothetical protein
VLQIESDNTPPENSSGLLTSTSTFPARAVAFSDLETSRKTEPLRQTNTISPNAAASANVPCEAFGPVACTHLAALSLLAVRDPIFTWCPSCANFLPSVSPTMPVPKIPIFIASFLGRHYRRKRAWQLMISER